MKQMLEKNLSRAAWTTAVLISFVASGCGNNQEKLATVERQQKELESLRAVNAEVQKLREENKDLARLRQNNEEVRRLREQIGSVAKVREENAQLRLQSGKPPASNSEPVAAAGLDPVPEPPKTIVNVAQAFDEAAFAVVGQVQERTEDLPMEGDRIMLDQSVIELLIPGLTNGGPYEVSGWLKAKGVTIKNYQQLNYLGLTNYQVLRAEEPKQ